MYPGSRRSFEGNRRVRETDFVGLSSHVGWSQGNRAGKVMPLGTAKLPAHLCPDGTTLPWTHAHEKAVAIIAAREDCAARADDIACFRVVGDKAKLGGASLRATTPHFNLWNCQRHWPWHRHFGNSAEGFALIGADAAATNLNGDIRFLRLVNETTTGVENPAARGGNDVILVDAVNEGCVEKDLVPLERREVDSIERLVDRIRNKELLHRGPRGV